MESWQEKEILLLCWYLPAMACDNDNMACEISCLHKYHFINVARLQYCQMTSNMSLALIGRMELEKAISIIDTYLKWNNSENVPQCVTFI